MTTFINSGLHSRWENISVCLDGVHFQDKEPETAWAPQEQAHRIAPTQHYLNTRDASVLSKLKDYFEVLPIQTIIDKETDFLSTHVPLYTAFHKKVFLIHTLAHSVLSLFPPSAIPFTRNPCDIVWLRNPLANIPVNPLPRTIGDFFALREGRPILDNTPALAWQLVACNPFLFGNTEVDAMESTVDYFWDGMSVSAPKLEDSVQETLDACQLLLGQDEQRKRFISDLTNTLSLFPGGRGVLYQIFIPHVEVNKVLYVCGRNGIPDKEHPNVLGSLIGLQYKDPSDIPNYALMQVRLLANRFINPKVASPFPTFVYTDVSYSQIQNFKGEVSRIVKKYLQQ